MQNKAGILSPSSSLGSLSQPELQVGPSLTSDRNNRNIGFSQHRKHGARSPTEQKASPQMPKKWACGAESGLVYSTSGLPL